MLKSARHAKILELIKEKEIETQEELCAELNALNYVVTQATISRDIRDLRLLKVAGSEKKYRYAYINENDSEISAKMRGLFRECVLSVVAAQNIVVVKTLSGNGANAAIVIDKVKYDGIVGSVAGDDTVLAVCVDNQTAEFVVEKITELLK